MPKYTTKTYETKPSATGKRQATKAKQPDSLKSTVTPPLKITSNLKSLAQQNNLENNT
ncbi:hypothetical protein ACGTJS_12560 [Faucicola mancuniensis]|uniref:hypothetical protein n=1 Tax=Faucicola mancuniensis TaxID=1309795 RepID=UPI0028E9124D|nr:hypothetical protein [uncultured Moraxella sp.]